MVDERFRLHTQSPVVNVNTVKVSHSKGFILICFNPRRTASQICLKVAEYTWFFPKDLYKKCIDRKVQHV
jgi:hypothetical protein